MCCFRDTRRLPLETHHAIRRPALKLENHVAASSNVSSRLIDSDRLGTQTLPLTFL